MAKARVIAYYLPQYHPIPENDKWWGKGFTEWRNVAKAKPLFKGHYQPHIPADLGFYDLRMPEVREEQARLAKEAGVEGFCYWHYWFDKNHKLLDRPFNEVLRSGNPDFPFCLGWANHDWSNKTWEKTKNNTQEVYLMKQTYKKDEYLSHFKELLPAFNDKRYITVDGKPLFIVFDPQSLPDDFITSWQLFAKENGLKGIHFVGILSNIKSFYINENGKKIYKRIKITDSPKDFFNEIFNKGFDAINSRGFVRAELGVNGRFRQYLIKFLSAYLKINLLKRFDYKKIIKYLLTEEDRQENVYPTLLPNWDRSPRSGRKAVIYENSTPSEFEKHLKDVLKCVENKSDEHKIVFLMSWNEWAEGNYVEPDLKFGTGYLDVLKRNLVD